MVTTYLFDLDGTIIDPAIYREIYHDVLSMIERKREIPLVEIELAGTKAGIRKSKDGKFDSGELCKHFELIDDYYEILGPRIASTDVANHAIITRMNKAVVEGARIGIVSNSFTRTILLYVKRYKLPVDFIFSAEEAGFMKSDVRFWRALVKAQNLFAHDCVVIGDDPVDDVKVPEKVGFKTERI